MRGTLLKEFSFHRITFIFMNLWCFFSSFDKTWWSMKHMRAKQIKSVWFFLRNMSCLPVCETVCVERISTRRTEYVISLWRCSFIILFINVSAPWAPHGRRKPSSRITILVFFFYFDICLTRNCFSLLFFYFNFWSHFFESTKEKEIKMTLSKEVKKNYEETSKWY